MFPLARRGGLLVPIALLLGAWVGCDDDVDNSDASASSASVGSAGGGDPSTSAGSGGAGGTPTDGCRSSNDCPGSECILSDMFCYDPEQPVVQCVTDVDCALGGGGAGGQAMEPSICEYVSPHCHPELGPNGATACVRGCASDEDCPAASICRRDHRCVARPCDESARCPSDFDCSPEAGQCQPKSCSTDADCAGFCVLGECHSMPGVCYLG